MPEVDTRTVELNDGWAGQCKGTPADKCGNPESPIPSQRTFVTRGWPTQELAEERIAQHAAEHETGEPHVEELAVFLERNGLVVTDDGEVTFADLDDKE